MTIQRNPEHPGAAEAEAERAGFRSRFLATANHELRQPLQTICFIQGMLANSVSDPAAGKLIKQLDQAVASMSQTLDRLAEMDSEEPANSTGDPSRAGRPMPALLENPVSGHQKRRNRIERADALANGLEACQERNGEEGADYAPDPAEEHDPEENGDGIKEKLPSDDERHRQVNTAHHDEIGEGRDQRLSERVEGDHRHDEQDERDSEFADVRREAQDGRERSP